MLVRAAVVAAVVMTPPRCGPPLRPPNCSKASAMAWNASRAARL
ncbi:hypothetical protein [Nonomuraea salmonea]